MANITYEAITPSYIENTTMLRAYRDGTPTIIQVAPVEGYVLHDNRLDAPEVDDIGDLTGNVIRGYTAGRCSVRYDYDFEVNPFELYAVPENSVPADQIFGSNNNHEVM